MAIKLYDHQVEARKLMMTHPYYALFMEQGTGKTMPVLFHISHLFRNGLIKNALIVAPKSALGAWSRDLEKLPEDVRKYINEDEVTIINYDMLHRRESLYDGTFDIIVLDESHNIKTGSSKRSKTIRKMGKRSKYRYILTGTPISNSKLHEFWAQYDFLNPSIFGTYTKFKKQYCIMDQWYNPKWYINQEQLECIINAHAFRITKDECLDLPEVLEDNIIKLELKEKKIYKEARDNLIVDYDMEIDNALVKTLRLRQIASGFIQDEEQSIDLKCDKIPYMIELLDGRKGLKTVVFAQFKKSVKNIEEALSKNGYTFITLDGDQPNKEIWKEFQSDDSIEVIVCQYQTANAGIDLFAADSIIFYEPTLSSSINDQARDRIHRIGQKRTVSYHYLLTTGTIETQIYNTITSGRDFSKTILQDYLREELLK